MNDEGRTALSSIAVSVSAAVLLGVSGVAISDPPEGPVCYTGTACGLGINSHGSYQYMSPYGQPGQSEGLDIYEDVGYCSILQEVCGCEGWKGGGPNYIQVWYGDPWDPQTWYSTWEPNSYHPDGTFSSPQYVHEPWGPECWNY